MTPIEAWSAVVNGEDAAIYAYSVAAAQLLGRDRRQGQAGLESHRQRRSRAAAALTALGAPAPSGASAYDLPSEVSRPRVARRLMADVDLALVGVYADAAASSTGADRRWAARSAADSATSAVAWGAAPQAFPTPASPAS